MSIQDRSTSNSRPRTFTLDSLAVALEQVQALHEISADLIAENVFGQPAQQSQGEAVARYSMDQTGCEELDSDGHWVRYEDLKHADPAEVERLR